MQVQLRPPDVQNLLMRPCHALTRNQAVMDAAIMGNAA